MADQAPAHRGNVVVVPLMLGWRNNRDEATDEQLELYGPGGRWERRQTSHGRVSGASLVTDLVAEGAHEGATGVVISVDRFAGPVSPEWLLAAIRDVAPGLLEEVSRG